MERPLQEFLHVRPKGSAIGREDVDFVAAGGFERFTLSNNDARRRNINRNGGLHRGILATKGTDADKWVQFTKTKRLLIESDR